MKKRIALLLASILLLTLLPAATLAASTPKVEPIVGSTREYVFANGTPITVSARNDNTPGAVITWDDGSNSITVANTAYIFGGSNAPRAGSTLASTSITMTGGTVSGLFGGNYKSGAVTNASVTITGGETTFIAGGGAWVEPACTLQEAVAGNSPNKTTNAVVNVRGGKVTYLYAGGGNNYTYVQNATVNMTDGWVGLMMSSGSTGYVASSTLNIGGGTVDEVAPVNRGQVGSTSIQINGGTVGQLNTGAADEAFKTDSTANTISRVEKVDVSITNGTVQEIHLTPSHTTNTQTPVAEFNPTNITNETSAQIPVIAGAYPADGNKEVTEIKLNNSVTLEGRLALEVKKELTIDVPSGSQATINAANGASLAVETGSQMDALPVTVNGVSRTLAANETVAAEVLWSYDGGRYVPTYDVAVTCIGPGESNVKTTREVDAGSIFRVKFYPEAGNALLSLTVNGAAYDPALLKVEGDALIYGINRIDEDYAFVAEFGEPFVVEVPEVEITDVPKTGEGAARGGFLMLLLLACGVALWRARRSCAKN